MVTISTTIMFTDILTKLDLSKNEAKIYETLLDIGQSTIGNIAKTANINRRNVYDSMDRLIEKGLVFEIKETRETIYSPVDPKKLQELIKEKETALLSVMPQMLSLYQNKSHRNDIFIYKGLEGWKNYMRDILRVGEDVYTIGGNGVWTDNRLSQFLDFFVKEAEKKNIGFNILFNNEVKERDADILRAIESNHAFLSKDYSMPCVVEIFGDHVVIFSNLSSAKIDETASFTVIVNKSIADTFRVWFQMMWNVSNKKTKKR